MKCIIPCAGESSRMHNIPKHLVQIAGKPLLQHVIDMWKDNVDGFVFVLKRSASYLWEYLPENSTVVFQDQPKGLADAILQAERCVSGKFIVALGDCIQKGEWEEGKGFDLGVGVWITDDEYEIRKSYSVEVCEEGPIIRVKEKPKRNINNLCGMGTYFLNDSLFGYIRQAKPRLGGGDLTEVLQYMIDPIMLDIYPLYFRGKYVNVTSPEDIKKAEEILR